MLFDRTLQAAMGLLDRVEKWAIWRQHDHVEPIFELRWNNDVEMWPRAVEDDEDFFINKYMWSQDGHQFIDESLEGGARDRSLFDNVVNQTHVGRYGKRDVNVSSTWSYDVTDSFAYWCTAFGSPSKDVEPRLVNVHLTLVDTCERKN